MADKIEVTGVDQAVVDKASAVLKSGMDHGASQDQIKASMFENGVPFSQLNKVFKAVSIGLGFITDPAQIKKNISTELENIDLNAVKDYDSLSKLVSYVQGKVKGSSESRVLSLIRSAAKAEELSLPTKPKAEKGPRGMSKLKAAYIDIFHSSPEITQENFVEALKTQGVCKSDKNAEHYGKMMFDVLSAVRNGQTSEEYAKSKS